ncbi:MAG: hypothetical protein BWK76_24100 [Desulfobulbaceae bacterium A2]|nr:MAG: hypothetical protein BWK76_24100 [Desulfobulbaceae bacterium A2]
MATSFDDTLTALEQAVAARADEPSLVALARKLKVAPNITAAELARLFALATALLPLPCGLAKVLLQGELAKTLYHGHWPGMRFPWDAARAAAYVRPYLQAVDAAFTADSRSIYPLHSEWRILRAGYPAVRQVLEDFLREREVLGQRPAGYLEELHQAIALHAQFERILRVEPKAIGAWREFMRLLDRPGCPARSWAAKNLGAIYRVDGDIIEPEIPPLRQMLGELGDWERRAPGVLGPFVDGFDDSFEGIGSLHTCFEPGQGREALREYVLGVLEHSAAEPYCPDVQSLAFYAHEFFETDADALQRLLRAGHRDIVEDALSHESDFPGRERLLALLGGGSGR